eukprot:TRINITY_DN21815_c0_g1_i1.p1 TRINITY_DN21815_c0_g1~~TRINITY_DN21815_c0_g1_i1.p1  ORF type:complete len:535 (-),score=65.62 TRINITY_DN21815_c0_g1_i1:155-1549(-)
MGGLGGLGGLGYGAGGFGRRTGQSRPSPRVPVSILTGFLGAGKTTMVQHILKNREGLKVGVVVNDVAEANIDSEVLKFEDADGIVGLQNGCACCSGRDDLFARLQDLVNSTGVSKLDKPWDRLVVECSGVAEPESIASELEAMGRRGESVMRKIFLAGIICVVDASAFWDMYNSSDEGDSERKPLSTLLVNQLESADTVIINKTDLVSSDDLERVLQLIKTLSPNARHFPSTHGALPLRTLLPAEPVDLDMPAYVPTLANRHGVAVQNAGRAENTPEHAHSHASAHDGEHAHSHAASDTPGHGHSHAGDESGHAHGHSHAHADGSDCAVCAAPPAAARHDRYGISSFVYRCKDKKFHPDRLATLARQLPVVSAELGFENQSSTLSPHELFSGLLRSKGFVKVSGSEGAYYWSHAGRRLEVSKVASAPAGWSGQELVFIGTGLRSNAITKALDECLISDADGAKL